MLKTGKKILCILLVVIMYLTSVPLSLDTLNASALENGVDQRYEIGSSDSIGAVLSTALDEEIDETMTTNNNIKSVSMYGTEAEVALKTDRTATVIVGIYDESGLQMFYSGYTEVEAESEFAIVEVEADSLPEHYCVKVFMLDENNMPLCQSLVNKEHTQAYEQFMEKDVNDFDEESVVNFDESEDTNFVVLKEDTVIVEDSVDKNVLLSADEENGIYVFDNIDDTIRKLNIDDTFYYEKEEYAIAIKVANIEIDGNKATLTRAEAEISDIFDFVKIDNATEVSESDIENAELGEGVSYLGKTEIPQTYGLRNIDLDKEISSRYDFSLIYGSVKASVGVGIAAQVKIYYDAELFGEDYINAEFCLKLSSKAEVSIGGKIELPDSIKFFDAKIPVGCGITADLTLKPVIEAEMKLTATATNEIKLGFAFETGEKVKKYCESDGETQVDVEADVEVTVGLNVTVAAKFVEIVSIGVSGTGGLNATGTLTVPGVIVDDNIEHPCSGCIDGILNRIATVTAFLKIGTKKISVTPVSFTFSVKSKIDDFYLSLPSGEFGWGKCPLVAYKVTFTVLDENSKPLAGAYVGQFKTDSDGVASGYLSNGAYTYTVSAKGLLDRTIEFFIKDESKHFEIDFSLPDINTSGVNRSGTCGPNLTYTLYNDGDLIISGIGKMNDYEYRSTPFYSEHNIKRLIVKDGVSSIGSYAFYNCTELKTVKLPNTITEIHQQAFYGCSNLTNIVIPNSVEEIGISAFNGCSNLKKITLGSGLKIINSNAFSGCGASEIYIPENVTNMGSYVFYSDTIESITVSPLNKHFKAVDGVLYNKNGTELIYYPKMKADYSFIIPDGVVTICANAFYYNPSIVKVKIPNTVKTIGDSAFYCCFSLRDIEFPKEIEMLGSNVFENTEWYNNLPKDQLVYIGNIAYRYISSNSNINIKKITIKEGTTHLAPQVFLGCDGLAIVDIPNTVISIGAVAFGNCKQLVNISIPDSVTDIGNHAFSDCADLKEVKLSNNLKKISDYTFSGCESLENITIPNSVEYIGNQAFYNCESLQSIILPESVNYIGKYCFDSRYSHHIEVTILNPECELYYNYNTGGLISSYEGFMDYGTLYGYKNSTAEIYSKQNGMSSVTFVPLDEPEQVMTFALRKNSNNMIETTNFNNAVKGEQYVIAVVKDDKAENLFAADNLLYIDQMTAGDTQITFNYIPKEFYALSKALVFGTCKHNYAEKVVTQATCTNEGTSEFTCINCGASYVDYVPVTDHSYESVATAATCYSTGFTTNTCTVCGDSYTSAPTDMIPHSFGAWYVVTPANCKVTGLEKRDCTACDYSETKDLPTTGHNYNNGVCTSCGDDLTGNCSCNCHAGGINGLIFKLILFFQKLFRSNKVCSCGVNHY